MAEPLSPEVEPSSSEPTTAPLVVIETTPAPPKKRRWIGWAIAGGVLVILLVVAFFVADSLARQYATGIVRERILTALKLDPATPVDVDLGDGSLLLQALAGRVNDVTVGIDTLTVGEVTGSAVLTARGVPLNESQPVEELGAVVTISEASVQQLSEYLSGIDLDSIELGRGVITVGTELSILFITLPVTVDLVPSAVDGAVRFTPETITLDDQNISVDDLRNNPIIGGLAGSLLNSQDFCVAASLPAALVVTDVQVVASDLVVTITGDGASLGELGTTGTCP
jgi:hypothetical protein